MIDVLIRQTVDNFGHWKQKFDEDEAWRRREGELSARLEQNVDDPNEAVALFTWDTLENARAYFTSPTVRQRLHEIGALETGEPVFLHRVE